MVQDYNEDGSLLPGATPEYRPNTTIEDLNKFLVIDSPTGTEDGQAELKAWTKKLRDHYKDCKAQNSWLQLQLKSR